MDNNCKGRYNVEERLVIEKEAKVYSLFNRIKKIDIFFKEALIDKHIVMKSNKTKNQRIVYNK